MPDPDLLSVREAAVRYHVTIQTIYLWIRKGVVPVVRVGPGRRTIRLPRVDADAVLMTEPTRSN